MKLIGFSFSCDLSDSGYLSIKYERNNTDGEPGI